MFFWKAYGIDRTKQKEMSKSDKKLKHFLTKYPFYGKIRIHGTF